MRGSIRARFVHIAVPLLFMACMAAVYPRRPGLYKRLVVEDGPLEWATVVVYVTAAVLGIRLCRALAQRRRYAWVLYYAVLTLAFIFIAGEEISWGQRIFGIASPDYFRERNVQGEIGLHNLSTIRLLLSPAYIAIGLGGALWHHQEPAELLLALGFLFFVVFAGRVDVADDGR
jgi:hypothetical protein